MERFLEAAPKIRGSHRSFEQLHTAASEKNILIVHRQCLFPVSQL